MESQEGVDKPAEFSYLPFEAQISIAELLLPALGLGSDSVAWRNIMKLSATSNLVHLAVLEAVRALAPAALGSTSLSPAAFARHIGTLLAGGGHTRWKALRPLRAVRPKQANRFPLQEPPKLSGASLCALAPQQLCLFGGRESDSGRTLGATRLITISSGIAIWDTLHSDVCPPARCYHTALAWERRGRRNATHMLAFGGAGEGDEGNENLLGDVWMAEVNSGQQPLSWRALYPAGEAPVARSSHVCAQWADAGALIFHGGLAADGVLGDTWVLKGVGGGCETQWSEVHTSGAVVKRAHHSGGLTGGSTLLVFSGQDETLGTVHSLASLDLQTAAWSLVHLPTDGPGWSTRRMASDGSHCGAPIARIDGAATAIPHVGLVLFGGVGDDFGFVPAHDAWLLRSANDITPRRRLALPLTDATNADEDAPGGAIAAPAVGPCGRACLGLCADGLRIYVYGGFDGEADLSDLWELNLEPQGNTGPDGKNAFNADAFKARRKRRGVSNLGLSMELPPDPHSPNMRISFVHGTHCCQRSARQPCCMPRLVPPVTIRSRHM